MHVLLSILCEYFAESACVRVSTCIRERDCMRWRVCAFMGACLEVVYVCVRELIAC